jgi:hypothetical protein
MPHPLPSKLKIALVGSLALIVPQAGLANLVVIPFKPANFSNPLLINNTFFTLQPNTSEKFNSTSSSGCEVDVTTITNNTRALAGVTTRVVDDVVYADHRCNGTLSKEEDTEDYYAQDNSGNVWYMGEISNVCDGGSCTLSDGSWLAGQDIFHIGQNAQPGIRCWRTRPWARNIARNSIAAMPRTRRWSPTRT